MKQAVSFAHDGGRPGSPPPARRWRTPRLCGVALTPANIIGAALALFFTSQVFLTHPASRGGPLPRAALHALHPHPQRPRRSTGRKPAGSSRRKAWPANEAA